MKPQHEHHHLLLILFLSCISMSYGDLYGNSPPPAPAPNGVLAPPPPFDVAGKQFPPESIVCNDPNTKCFGRTLQCPKQCPELKPADPKAKACFIDCNRPSCEDGSCRTRKPNCEGNGAACYDPRFVGGDGVMFYFHGKANHHFALVSDHNLQINARFIGIRPAGRPRDFTWIQSLGIIFEDHTFTLSATQSSSWDNSLDHLAFTFDDTPIYVNEGYLSSWTSPSNELNVERTSMVNSVTVTLQNVFEIMVTVVPVTKEDNRIHKYHIPENDCFAHLEVQFKFLKLSEKVEGVLGQTYRPDFENPVKRGVSMPIMSGEERYITSSLLSPSCKYCIFSPEIKKDVVGKKPEISHGAMDCTSEITNGNGVVCRR